MINLTELRHLIAMADAGDAQAQNNLATLYATGFNGALEEDYQAALYWYNEACKQGHNIAKWSLGALLLSAKNSSETQTKLALRLIMEAAKGGDENAAQFLVNSHESGRYNLPKSEKMSLFWQEKLANEEFRQQPMLNTPISVDSLLGINFERPDEKDLLDNYKG